MPRVRADNDARYALRASFVDENGDILDAPVVIPAGVSGITATQISNWDTAYGWGDHSTQGYLTTETDPVFAASDASGISSSDITNWDTAYGWGNHSTQGYLTTETDPVFAASDASGISSSDITNWDTAYGWGDHSTEGYWVDGSSSLNATSSIKCGTDGSAPVGFTVNDGGGNANIVFNHFSNAVTTAGYNTARIVHNSDSTSASNLSFRTGSGGVAPTERLRIDDLGIDVTGAFTATGTLSASGYNSANWDTAYGWGDHSSAGYLTSHQDISGKLNTSGGTLTGNLTVNARLDVGDGTGGDHEIRIYKADNEVSDHIQFYNGTTRIGEIGCQDSTWLRINQVTAKNIYTPRYIRADAGFFVDGTTKGINGSGNFIGGTITGASDANVANWNSAYTDTSAATNANTANAIVKRNENGDFNGRYINGSYMNMSHGASTRNTDTVFYSSTDNYIRKNNKAGFKTALGLSVINDGAGGGQYGSVAVDGGAVGGYEGYSIGGRAVFMHNNNTTTGLYNDVNNQWILKAIHNGQTEIAHAGSTKGYTYASGWRVTGNLLATSNVYAYYSDERLKTFTGAIESPLEKIAALHGVYYTHNDKARELGYEGSETQVGLIAQEVKDVMPECIGRAPIDDDGEGGSLTGEDYMTVDYPRLIPLLIEGIKELTREVEQLKEQLNAVQ